MVLQQKKCFVLNLLSSPGEIQADSEAEALQESTEYLLCDFLYDCGAD